jgi:hypothetical protein
MKTFVERTTRLTVQLNVWAVQLYDQLSVLERTIVQTFKFVHVCERL